MQSYIALSTASISMMLSNCKKDSDDYELLRAVIMMSRISLDERSTCYKLRVRM